MRARRVPPARSFLHVASALQREPARECLGAVSRIFACYKENCAARNGTLLVGAASLQLNRDNDAAAARCRRNGLTADFGTSP